jgi:hypothetical protein
MRQPSLCPLLPFRHVWSSRVRVSEPPDPDSVVAAVAVRRDHSAGAGSFGWAGSFVRMIFGFLPAFRRACRSLMPCFSVTSAGVAPCSNSKRTEQR